MTYFIAIDLKKYEDQLSGVELNTDLQKVNSHHITVFVLGNLTDKRLERISKRLEAFEKEKFTLTADSICSFSEDGEDRFLALSFKDRKPLFNLLFELIEYLEEIPTGGSALQHITLYRAKESKKLPEMERKIIGESKESIDIEVDNLVLYKSVSKETGILNDYKEITRISLN